LNDLNITKTLFSIQADVVCKQLGFLGAARATIESEFGNVHDTFSYDNVDCYGTEDALDDCTHVNEDEENCSGNEAAGAICIADSTTSTTTESSSPAGSNSLQHLFSF